MPYQSVCRPGYWKLQPCRNNKRFNAFHRGTVPELLQRGTP